MDFPRRINLWHQPVSYEVQAYTHEDEQQFQSCELIGAMFVTQVSKGDSLKGILCNCDEHHAYVPFMVRVVEQCGDRIDKCQYEHSEGKAYATYHDEGCAVHPHLVAFFLVHEAEEGGLHTKGEQHQQQCSLGIDVVIDAVVGARLQCIGVKGHHQVVQEPTDDATHPIHSCVLDQSFYTCHVLLNQTNCSCHRCSTHRCCVPDVCRPVL